MDMNIGQNLRKIRERHGLSILDVSIELGYSESHIAQIERDKRRPSLDCLIDLMEYYGCEANELFGTGSSRISSGGSDATYEGRLNKLSFRDKNRAEKTIEAVLQSFEEVV